MKIKHYIITRFNNSYACKEIPKEEFFSEKSMFKKLEMFKNFNLKSLKSQTNQNFTDLLFIHDDIPQSIYNELISLTIDYPNIEIIKNKELDSRLGDNAGLLSSAITKYLKNNLDIKDYDFLITSRFDYDDMLYNGAVEDIHNSVKEDTLIKYFGFRNGCTLDYNTGDLYKFNKNSADGMISIGISLIYNLQTYGLLPFNIYNGKHSKIRTAFFENNRKFVDEIKSLDDNYLNSNKFWDVKITQFPAWVYVRHNEAKSAFIPGRFEKKLHYSNVPIEKEIINEKFFNVF